LGYVKIVKKGSSRGALGLKLTRYSATDKLITLFKAENLIELPVWFKQPEPQPLIRAQQIEKKRVNGRTRKTKLPLEIMPSQDVDKMRENVRAINRVLNRGWYDLEIADEEFGRLADRMAGGAHVDGTDDEYPFGLNLTRRQLYRVFNSSDLSRGGRFYGGWWQEVPKEYRRKILVDGKPSVEVDYCGLHAAMLYLERGLVPPDDPYAGILSDRKGGREVVKRAFNAMINAKVPMTQAPSKLNLTGHGILWTDLSHLIMEIHEPIRDAFYSDSGARLQRLDSDMAEGIMLRMAEATGVLSPNYDFTKGLDGAPWCLPVHDSFIVHHGRGGELSDVMKEEFQRVLQTSYEPKLRVTRFDYPMPKALGPEHPEYLKLETISVEDVLKAAEKGPMRRMSAAYSQRSSGGR
jgi:hypothetical protein